MTIHYVSPSDNLSNVVSSLKAGDTLILRDGIYYQSLQPTVSGTQLLPINIRAEHDGMAIVDGQNTRRTLYIFDKNYINIDGIRFQNAYYPNSHAVGEISGASSNMKIRRCSFISAGAGNNHLFLIAGASQQNLVEDCFMTQGYGNGRYGIVNFGGSHDNVFRRNYVRYLRHTGGGGPCACFSDYGGSYSIWENNIADMRYLTTSLVCNSVTARYSPAKYQDGNHNLLYGEIYIGHTSRTTHTDVHGIETCDVASGNDTYINNAFIDFYRGIDFDDTPNEIYQNNTFVSLTHTTDQNIALQARNIEGCDRPSTATVKNNSFLTVDYALGAQSGTTITADYNNFSDIRIGQTYGSGKIINNNPKTITPNYNTTKYGKGAYLFVPSTLRGKGEGGTDIGAEVLYCYQNGVLTNEPLFPWKMEDRIFREAGISITWEANGGLWKTLDGIYLITDFRIQEIT